MSKRIPLSTASRQFDEFAKSCPIVFDKLKAYPELCTADDECAELSYYALCYWKAGKDLENMRKVAVARDYWGAEDLCFLARWYRCRQVYRIDDTVLDALKRQPLDATLPVEALLRLPYPVIYVDAKTLYASFDGLVETKGFAAYIDRSRAGRDELQFIFFLKAGGRGRVWLPLVPGLKLDEAVQMIEDLDRSQNAKRGLLADPNVERKLDENHADFVMCLSQAINVALYILSAENDPEVVYAPPTGCKSGQKAGRRTNPETITLLGARIGHAIGEARRAAESPSRSSDASSRTVSPYIRKAHWHHYWIGARKGRTDGMHGDELIVKWIPPVPVNQELGEVIETLHMDK